MLKWQKLEQALDLGVKNKIAPYLALGVWEKGKDLTCFYAGKAGPQTKFDLASLTKPLCTALLCLNLVAQKKITWQTKLEEIWGSSLPDDKKDLTIARLLTHSAGFCAHRAFYTVLLKNPKPSRKGLLKAMLLNEKLTYEPGTSTIYSDLGYLLLGLLLEDLLGTTLDNALKDLYKEHDIKGGFYLPLGHKPPCPIENFAPCGELETKGRAIGEVHDGNSHALDGITGHAGLFGGLREVYSPLAALSNSLKGSGCWPKALIEEMVLIDNFTKESTKTMGFDTPTGKESSAGEGYLSGIIGHLGFTGTSFWWHPIKNTGVILLTDRLENNTSKNEMLTYRRLVHSAFWQAINNKEDQS